MKKNKYTIIALGIIFLVGLVVISSTVSAVFWQCFQKGEIVNFCNPDIRDRTCGSSIGCIYCMNSYDEGNACYTNAFFNRCNQFTPDCSSTTPENIDSEPPILEINSPIQDIIYTEKSVPLDILTNERSHISFLDNLNTRRKRPTRLCRNCISYDRSRRFSEGLNNIKFIAEDVVGNSVEQNISFFVDTILPKIYRTEPRRGLASGFFNLEFSEDNPIFIILNFGNELLGYSKYYLNFEQDCFKDRNRYSCGSFVDIQIYNGQEITFWFNVSDIAKTSITSRITSIQVDTVSPVINSINYTIDRRRLELILNISEENLDKVEFRNNNDSRLRWSRLCSRLRNGICFKRLNFREGNHNIDIQVSDEAGNSISQNIEFTI